MNTYLNDTAEEGVASCYIRQLLLLYGVVCDCLAAVKDRSLPPLERGGGGSDYEYAQSSQPITQPAVFHSRGVYEKLYEDLGKECATTAVAVSARTRDINFFSSTSVQPYDTICVHMHRLGVVRYSFVYTSSYPPARRLYKGRSLITSTQRRRPPAPSQGSSFLGAYDVRLAWLRCFVWDGRMGHQQELYGATYDIIRHTGHRTQDA